MIKYIIFHLLCGLVGSIICIRKDGKLTFDQLPMVGLAILLGPYTLWFAIDYRFNTIILWKRKK